MTEPKEVSFIAADAVSSETEAAPTSALIQRESWEDRLREMAQSKSATFRVPRNEDTKRAQVVDAVLDAFTLLGGTPRLTLWANENYGEFIKIYAKLAPRQLEQETKHDGGVRIIHVLPKGPLDE